MESTLTQNWNPVNVGVDALPRTSRTRRAPEASRLVPGIASPLRRQAARTGCDGGNVRVPSPRRGSTRRITQVTYQRALRPTRHVPCLLPTDRQVRQLYRRCGDTTGRVNVGCTWSSLLSLRSGSGLRIRNSLSYGERMETVEKETKQEKFERRFNERQLAKFIARGRRMSARLSALVDRRPLAPLPGSAPPKPEWPSSHAMPPEQG